MHDFQVSAQLVGNRQLNVVIIIVEPAASQLDVYDARIFLLKAHSANIVLKLELGDAQIVEYLQA